MTNREALQWLLDHKAELILRKVRGNFSLRVMVKDPHGGDNHYTEFYIEDVVFPQNWIGLIALALKESVDDK